MKLILPVFIGAAGLFSMSLLSWFLQTGQIPLWVISRHQVVNFTFTMQMLVLPLSLLAVAFVYYFKKSSFLTFFRAGMFSGNTSSDQQASWRILGPILSVAFTLGTLLYMSVGVSAANGRINQEFFSLLPLIILFSITNAWSEEIFSRFVIVSGLYGKIKPVTICWISAIVFGVPHYFGTPSGFSGIIMSGFLGWMLAKSVIETKGIGWALFIHFLQDLVIFGGGAMILAGHR